MKNIQSIIISVLTLCFFNQTCAQNVARLVFSLKENPDTIFFNEDKLDKYFVLNQKATLDLNINSPRYFGITNNSYQVIYLEPGFELQIKGNSFDESLNFEGIGAQENNYLVSKKKIYKKFNSELDFFALKAMDNDVFYSKIIDYKDEFHKNLNEYKFSSAYFKKIELSSINFMIAKRIKSFQGKNKTIDKTDIEKFPRTILFPFENVNFNDELALAINNFAYAEFLQKSFEAILNKKIEKKKSENYNNEILLLAKKRITNEKILNNFLFNYSYLIIKYLDKKEIHFNTFTQLCTDEKHKKIIYDLYNSFKEVRKGVKSPGFNFIDSKGKVHTLDDFKGKITYIDVWATWCKPCIADYVEMQKLFNQYGEEINIVSICYLDSKDRWASFLDKKKPKWKQLFATEQQQLFFKKYNITGVPRYILLDKEGKVIFSSSPPPKIIGKTLQSLIK